MANGFTLPVQNQRLPQQQTPVPKSKMRKLQWNKIPLNKVLGQQNVFSVGNKYGKEYKLDFDTMEQLFSIKTEQAKKAAGEGGEAPAEKKKKSDEVSLL